VLHQPPKPATTHPQTQSRKREPGTTHQNEDLSQNLTTIKLRTADGRGD